MHKNKKHKRSKNGGKQHRNQHVTCEKKPVEGDVKVTEEFNDLPKILQVKHSDIMGRYLVTSRDVRAGETLLSDEEPLAIGPCQGGSPALCLGCYTPLNLPLRLGYHCPKCGLPMCNAKCASNEQHKPECELLYKGGKTPTPEMLDENPQFYNAIVPLRCLYLRDKYPDKWRILMTMESHNEIRQTRPNIWGTNQETVVQPIRDIWSLGQLFSEIEIHTVCGILEVNAFEVGPPGRSVRALFPRAFLMAHDCVPNTCHTDKQGRLQVRAAMPIPSGSSVTLSYAYTLQGTLKRREHLREGKFFLCCCNRCSDPTELNTYCSALLCPKCGSPRVLSTCPLDDEAEWKCTSCKEYSVNASSVYQLINKLGDEAEKIESNDLEQLENFIVKYERVLPSSHYLILGIKHSLSQVYGKIPGYMINDLTNEQLMRKRDICKKILKVFDVLEPGMSRLRGVTMYELHAPLMILTTRAVQARSILKVDLQAALKEVANCLELSADILKFEPEGSEERSMADAAKQALQQVNDWRKQVSNSK